MRPLPPGTHGRIEELTAQCATRSRVVREEEKNAQRVTRARVVRVRIHGDALLAPLRTALSGRHSISRVPVCYVARDVREPHVAVSLHRPWPVADSYAARFSDRAAYPRRRPEVAREEGWYADHGRRTHHHQHHRAHAVMGGLAAPVCLD